MTEDPQWWRARPSSRPRAADGIRARSQRGAIGRSWWSGRFIAVLESLGVGGRLGRGRSYARAGQVLSLGTGPGSVQALVQGSRPEPYAARIGVTTFGKAEWARIEQALADDAWYAAKLLAGEMPEDIEDVFSSVGLSLFPAQARDLSMDCTCPDREVPCKHLAATCYLLAESFDEDPFAILALRGRDRETLLANVRAHRGGPTGTGAAAAHRPPALADCLDGYFRLAAPLPSAPPSPNPADALLDELPPVTMSVRGRRLVELLRPAYRALGEPD